MSETQCLRISLKPSLGNEFVDFARRIRKKPDEVKAVLAELGILAEPVFLDASIREPAVIIFIRAESLEASNATLLASK